MFYDPVRQRPLEANVLTLFLGFDPFMLKDLFALGLEFPVKRGIPKEFGGRQH